MTTTDTLPKLRTEMGRILCGAETREKYGEVWKHAAEIVRRCNDYPDIAALVVGARLSHLTAARR